MRWHTLLLAGLLLTTGCIGMGGDDDSSASDDELDTQSANETETQDEATSKDPFTREWTKSTHNGSITGTSFAAPSPPSEGQSFSFTAESGIEALYINLTAEGGELQMNIAPPDCSINSGCEETVVTEGGEATYVNETAESGEWNIRFFAGGAFANDVQYTAKVNQGINATATS